MLFVCFIDEYIQKKPNYFFSLTKTSVIKKKKAIMEKVVLRMNLEGPIGFRQVSDLIIKDIQEEWTAWKKKYEKHCPFSFTFTLFWRWLRTFLFSPSGQAFAWRLFHWLCFLPAVLAPMYSVAHAFCVNHPILNCNL